MQTTYIKLMIYIVLRSTQPIILMGQVMSSSLWTSSFPIRQKYIVFQKKTPRSYFRYNFVNLESILIFSANMLERDAL